MTFGLKNAAQSFQRFLDSLFRDLPFCFVYIDDILIASRNLDEHISHLKEIFRRLDENGLVLKISKCIFAKPEVDFLGHHVSASGIRPTTGRIQAILDFNRPSDFLHDSKLASPSSFVQQLRNTFSDLRPVLPSHHTKQKPFIFRDLATCTHVFVRTDSVRTSLQPPYEGPYPVIKRYAKYFDISIKGVSRTISIDRLKPCFFADPDPYKPTLVDKSSTSSTSPSTGSATPHHSQQSTSEQSSKLRVRFAEPPA
ncbi:retrovirus-related Pol polyprotein from transposon 17.6 [Trichonephila clavata]|uniref:Retrovirus-related Pol polyprotein from transposon 17.6 n=1 Tax=Trichonephila clavata TaxID=2740835 RepID=A0A8X6KZ13_TRICU|nr:retrovirus-related Pol polyprotein from transposon 17.6 [Trichonephila clavata]